jgi:hypothetical protein
VRLAMVLSFAGCVGVSPSKAQTAPVIDNERVTVWDIRLSKGGPAYKLPHDLDTVVMFLEGGTIKTTTEGKASTDQRSFGDALFVPKGSDAQQELLSDEPAHEIVFVLKDSPSVVYQNPTGLPAAFPRPGSEKVLDTARVVVWRYSWVPGQPTPQHFHDKDVVLAYRFDGDLKSVGPDGAQVVNRYKSGDIRFNRGNRSHYEELTNGKQSAVLAELK